MLRFIRVSCDWGYVNRNIVYIYNFVFEKWLEFRLNMKFNIFKGRMKRLRNGVIIRF